MIKKVFVVHKTHLDIGFTNSASHVLNKYVETYIPQAIETAYACNKDGKRNFVWTIGSFLIDYYLDHAQDPQSLIDAIEAGYISWHGLALTTHTELMDGKLFRDELEMAKRLDERFGKTTITAKMTDVPGHTHAIVPYLAEYGIQYLHVGINSSSMVVDVPALCRYRYGDHEVILNYASAYGGADTFGEYALEFAHTADNMGPPTPDRVWAEIERLQAKYPGAEIVSATMDEFAREILPYKDQLPVINEEMGDTWIHGAATDPYKVAVYEELLRLRDQWVAAQPQVVSTADYREYVRNLMLICEHTWGRDSKRWFSDYKNWDKESFRAARKRDLVTEEDVRPAAKVVYDFATAQSTFTDGLFRYSTLEESWQEQRDYLNAALAVLPEPWHGKAVAAMAALRPEQLPEEKTETNDRTFAINGYEVEVKEDGALAVLSSPAGVKASALGRFGYHTYGWVTVWKNYLDYNRDLERTREWSEPDFAKPGLENLNSLRDMVSAYGVDRVEQWDNSLRIWLKAEEKAAEEFGAPRCVVLTYTFGQDIDLNLQWFEKDASRIPECLYLDMNLDAKEPADVTLYKLDQPIDPYHVRKGGNRKLHVSPVYTSGNSKVTSFHAPLLSVGGRHLYDVDDAYGNVADGMSYILFNNRWDTNFRMWYEENASFDFKIHLQA